MKLVCTQENLNKGLSLVGRMASNKATLPVLSNILLATESGRLKLSATDLEIGISTWIGAKIDQDGAITIPARLLVDYIISNADKKIILELKDTTLSLSSEKYQTNIKGISASEFPSIPKIKTIHTVSVNSTIFKEALSQIVFACSLDDNRPSLSGILFSLEDNILSLVATDSYRLAEKKIVLANSNKDSFKIIIPQKSILELVRILPEEDSVEIIIGENQLQFNFSSTELASRLIEGTYPAYQEIIPQNIETKVEINKEEFANAIKIASIFARESANNIKIAVKKDGYLYVSAVSPHLGDNQSKIEAGVNGPDLEIAFNAKFLLDFLAAIKDERIIMELVGPFSPALFKPIKTKNYLYIIMPLKIEG